MPSLPTKGSLTILNTSAITCAFGSGVASIGSASSPLPLTNGGGLASPGCGNSFSATSSSSFTPAPLRAETKQHRHQVAFAQALLEGVVQFLARQAVLALVEVVVHHRLVDLDDLVDDLLVPVGDRAQVAVAARVARSSRPRSCRRRRAG